MELLGQRMKEGMELCKKQARVAGLQFQNNTLEYVVTNQDMLEIMPKHMIPTLYDYWVHDVEVIQGKWMYEMFPHNPYETVINTRPPISYYNQDNADWTNIFIFYHVLGHIDWFQNNVFFKNTWNDDFCGQALADKRLLNSIREERGAEKRWVDYVIEFARSIDNLVGYYKELEAADQEDQTLFRMSEKINYYFGQFLRERHEAKTIELTFYYDEIGRYNRCMAQQGVTQGEVTFFEDNFMRSKFPEFNDLFKKWKEKEQKPKPKDLLEHLMIHSDFLNKEENKWMKDVIQVVRRTSLYFQPQIITKICNEGWASKWHEELFLTDERMKSWEVDYAKVDSAVTQNQRVGINPYAAGKNLFLFLEDMARKGKLSPEYQLVKNLEARRHYDCRYGEEYAKQVLFEARKYMNDYLLINFLSDQDFQDFIDKHKLFVVGYRPSKDRWDTLDMYIKSKSGKEYRRLLNQMLYHPPSITIDSKKARDGELYLTHAYEGRSLYTPCIKQVLIGLEFFWGKRVKLETTEYEPAEQKLHNWWERVTPKYKKARVLYVCENKKVERKKMDEEPAIPMHAFIF